MGIGSFVPSGHSDLDLILGGGFKRGGVTAIYGSPCSAKTTLCRELNRSINEKKPNSSFIMDEDDIADENDMDKIREDSDILNQLFKNKSKDIFFLELYFYPHLLQQVKNFALEFNVAIVVTAMLRKSERIKGRVSILSHDFNVGLFKKSYISLCITKKWSEENIKVKFQRFDNTPNGALFFESTKIFYKPIIKKR